MENENKKLLFNIKHLFTDTEIINVTIEVSKKDIDSFNKSLNESCNFPVMGLVEVDGVIQDPNNIRYTSFTIPMVGTLNLVEKEILRYGK